MKDTIEIPIHDDLDAGGWDARKALSLLRKSNGPLSEWLYSPVVYSEEEGFLERWRGVLAEVYSPKAAVDHYRGLAYQMWRGSLQKEQVKAKSYLYCLRAVLSAEWVLEHQTPAPVPFADLLPQLSDAMRGAVDGLLQAKSRSGEKELMDRVEVLNVYLEEQLGREVPHDLPKPPNSSVLLDEVFRESVSRARSIRHVKELTLPRVQKPDVLLFKTVAGSKAYGTDHGGSDTDYRGVFAMPRHLLGGMKECSQVQDERGDEVYFELEKVVSMLGKGNPNMLELLYMPQDCVVYKHPAFDLLDPAIFLSKQCELSFANYAVGQVKKARGLNKKIVNPEPEARKGLVDFCYVLRGQGSVPLKEWLAGQQLEAKDLGAVSVQHAPDVYSLYDDLEIRYRGIFSGKDPNEIICSSVPIEAKPVAWMVCHVDAYRKHCKSHREYWQWVENRNENRYQSSNVAGYDAKNMMHTFRLLDVAEEIALEGRMQVRRPNRAFLLQILSGELAYDVLLDQAEEKMEKVRAAYAGCSLPDEPDAAQCNAVLQEIREMLR